MKQKQSILFLSKLFYPHIGGVEKHLQRISSCLIEKGYSVTILTEQYDKKLPLYQKKGMLEIYRIPISKHEKLKKFLIWKWIFIHFNLIISHDIIHAHDVFYWLLPFRILIPFKKVFITFHGYEGYPLRLGWKLQRKISEILTNGNICVGDFMKKWYGTNPNLVIYGGVDRATDNKPANPCSAVFFGRLDEQTGILEYIGAYKKIKEHYPKFALTVVGDGKFKRKIPKNVHLVEFIANIEPYIERNRFIFVSRYLSILEALVQKKMVIAIYDNPIKRDYLLLSPFKKYIKIAKNSEEAAGFVIDDLENKSKDDYIDLGYRWAIKQTWEKVSESYLKLWKTD